MRIALPILLLVAAGCNSAHRTEVSPALRAKLGTIETVQLKDLAVAEPVTVEQATQALAQRVEEPNEATMSVDLTLDQVRAATLANNLALKVELVSPPIARAVVDEERAKFEAAFYGSTGFIRSESAGTGVWSKTTTYEAGIAQPLPTGGSVIVGLPFNDARGSDSVGVAEAWASVSYVQSLLRGAGTSINTQSIRVACLEGRMVDARTKLNAIHLLANADTAYWRLFSARKELDVRNEQYKLAQDQLRHARKKVASGSAAKIEIVRAEAGLSSRLEAVINAETEVLTAERDLRRIMNRSDMPFNAFARIIPRSEPHPQGLDLDEQALIKHALANRMEAVELEQQLAIDDLGVERARNAALPDIRLNTRYATHTQGDTWSDAYNNLGQQRHDDTSIGLSAVIPLGNRGPEARLHRARLTRIQDLARRDQLEQAIQQEVQEAVSEMGRNWRRILAAEQGAEAAYRDYRVEQSQFRLGVRNSTDVLFSATRMADAQLSRIRASAEYEIAQIRLARATGTLLGYGRICLGAGSNQ